MRDHEKVKDSKIKEELKEDLIPQNRKERRKHKKLKKKIFGKLKHKLKTHKQQYYAKRAKKQQVIGRVDEETSFYDAVNERRGK